MVGKAVVALGLLALFAAYYLSSQSTSTLPSWPLFRFGLFLNTVLNAAFKASSPPHIVIFDEATGFLASKSLYLACKFGLADHLHNGPLSIQELAVKANTDPATTNRVMKFLAVRGYFQRVDDKVYANNALSEYLRKDHPQSLWALIQHLDLLHRAVASGFEAGMQDEQIKPFQYGLNTTYSMFDYLALPENKHERELFDLAMVGASAVELEAILIDYPWPHTAQTIIDVGGGIGHLAAALLRIRPLLKALIFDLEVPVSRDYWRKEYQDVISRVEFAQGSFFESVSAGGDLYVLKHILHDWNDTDSLVILKKVAEAMRETKKLHPEKNPIALVLEGVYDFPPAPRITANLDMLMLTFRGQERSLEEYERLFEAAGLKRRGVYPLRTRLSAIEAELR